MISKENFLLRIAEQQKRRGIKTTNILTIGNDKIVLKGGEFTYSKIGDDNLEATREGNIMHILGYSSLARKELEKLVHKLRKEICSKMGWKLSDTKTESSPIVRVTVKSKYADIQGDLF